jgi:uncharacterized protein
MIIEVSVKPLSRKEAVEALPDGRWKVFVKDKPVEGRANESVRILLAEHFKVSRSHVRFLQGLKSKRKRVEILGKDGL